MKLCLKCDTPKDEKEFREGNRNTCYECEKEYARQYKVKKPPPSKAGASQYSDMSYAIGMFIGEFKGLKKYM